MALKEYPTLINNTAIPFMKQWSMSKQAVKNTYTTQAGYEYDLAIRDRLVISASTTCLWATVQQFLAFNAVGELTVQIYKPGTGYESHSMRIDSLSYNLIKNSEDLTAVDGVYELSFTLREY